MTFNSYIFILFFLPLAVVGYFLLNRTGKIKYGLLWLVAMSCWFYGMFSIEYLLLFMLNIGVTHFVVCSMQKTDSAKQKKMLFLFAIVFHIGLLLFYKYTNFFLLNIARITGGDMTFLNIALPVGISFYTFRQLAYVIDCYRGDTAPYPFLEYASYALFFPLLIQGPIARHEEVIPQFRDKEKKAINYENMSKGVYAFALGLAKKVLLADTLAPIVAKGFEDAYFFDTTNLLLVVLCYTFQIYFDFSGYCDMAYGIGKMFNLELPINFNSPYKAVSISDFWDRWHMTLTRFFTKYIYFSLGGNRKGKLRTYVNIMIVFLVSGFWHGANWTFVLWGALNGLIMCLERAGKKWIEKIPDIIRRAVTFVVVTLLWSLFRADFVQVEWFILKKLGAGQFGAVSQHFTQYFNELTEMRFLSRFGMQGLLERFPAMPIFVLLALCFVIVFFCKNTKEKTEQFCFEQGKKYVGKMLFAVVLLTWSILSLSNISEFIYFNF